LVVMAAGWMSVWEAGCLARFEEREVPLKEIVVWVEWWRGTYELMNLPVLVQAGDRGARELSTPLTGARAGSVCRCLRGSRIWYAEAFAWV